MTDLLERPLPHSPDAERAILGAIILDNSLATQAAELLSPADFYVQAHQHVFRAILALADAGSAIDPILIGEELRRNATSELVGGVAFVSELTAGLPHFTNVAAYAKVVKEHALRRGLVKLGHKLMVDGIEGEDEPRALLGGLRDRLSALDEECVLADGGSRPSLLVSFADFMRADFDDGEVIAFHARSGEVVLVQSVTNHGKSTLVRTAAVTLATGGELQPVVGRGAPRRVMLLNFEGSAGWFQSDLRVMTRDFTGAEFELLKANLFPTPAPMLDGEPLSLPRHMRALENAIRRAGGADVLILDTASAAFYLRNENDNAEVANSVMKPLVKLARRLNCLIVLVHHVGKAKAEEGATREQAHRGRGASAWGDFSSAIFNLDADPHDQDRVTLTCAKRKDGAGYERVLRLDRGRRWFVATDEVAVKPCTNNDLVIEVMERADSQISTAEIERMLVGKMARSTVMKCLNRLADQGKVGSPRRGWWVLLSVCPTCLTPIEGRTTCTNCGGDENSLPDFNLPLEVSPASNGNGFRGGKHAEG